MLIFRHLVGFLNTYPPIFFFSTIRFFNQRFLGTMQLFYIVYIKALLHFLLGTKVLRA